MGVAAGCSRWGDGEEEDDFMRLLMSMKSENNLTRVNMFDRSTNAQDVIVHINGGQDN